MKVIGVNASPRGKDSNTLRLVNAVLEGAKDEGADTEFIDLHTLRIEVLHGLRDLLRDRGVHPARRFF